jgi:diadenosine tetraphosphatase ApaH/serine/threonine PP2A family protein phosphatase
MTPASPPAPARLAPGHRIYAIGDVHGCLDRLTALHNAIADDLRNRPVLQATLVHLGDYIDRGPDSAGVITYLCSTPSPPGIAETVNLLGNHEDLFLAALDSRSLEAVTVWLMDGGGASLASWGIGPEIDPPDWPAHIPSEHIQFIRGLSLTYHTGPYLFVHAGIRPGVALNAQEREDLLWIRWPFLSCTEDLGAVIVHGHTPSAQPEVRRNRIGIDTGAVLGGKLTCAVLDDTRVGFIQK